MKLEHLHDLVLSLELQPPATTVPGLDSRSTVPESEGTVCRVCGKNVAPFEIRTLRDLERWHIARVIEACGSLVTAAETLGINYSTLWRKRKRYKML